MKTLLKEMLNDILGVDFRYPVGSYYETSDANFDPNTAWGGTWELETAGQVHVSAGTGYAIGTTGGEATHMLTVAEMPNHIHPTRMTWGDGTGNVAIYTAAGQGNTLSVDQGRNNCYPAGGDQAHNNMQPYIVVNRWHRTA